MAEKKIYQWTAAVRIEHWWHVAAMATLVFTGFYIHMPFLKGGNDDMGWMRFAHFVSMYVLIFGLLIRVYLAFFSRKAADWKELLPLPGNLAGIPEMVMFYLFLKKTHRPYKRYNPLQGLVYTLMGVMLLVMTFTGFAMHGGWLHSSFAWVNTMLGGEPATRLVHYCGMWVLIYMSAVHTYFVIRQSLLEKDRTLMSMVDGYRSTPE